MKITKLGFYHFCFICSRFQNDRIYESIIRGDWYLMPAEDQAKYMIFMHNAQHAKALTVGGIAPLNMATCVSVSKTKNPRWV